MACRGHARAARRARAAARVQVSSLAPETGHPKGCPVSGAAPSARVDPLRSIAKGDSRPLSRSPHADLKTGSDLNCSGAPETGVISLRMIPVFLTSGDLHFESACRGPAGKIVQDFPSGNCRSWPKPTYCFSPEKVTQNMVYAVLPCTMFSAFNSLVIFCRKKICRFYKKFLTFSLPCGIHKSGDGRHPSV